MSEGTLPSSRRRSTLPGLALAAAEVGLSDYAKDTLVAQLGELFTPSEEDGFNLIQQLTVLENLEVPMFYLGIPPLERRRRAMELAEKVGLTERSDHRPVQLSGGQQQRVCIARALINEPLILLADEPTGALDSKTGQAILELFDELVKTGRTIIIVTHDPTVAHRCQRVIHLHDGRVSKDERNAHRAVVVEGGQLSPAAAGDDA